MRKYAINYSRSFPDHRISHDFKRYQQLRHSPITAYRNWKAGVAINFIKYFQIHACTISLGLVFAIGLYKAYGIDNAKVMADNKNNRDVFKWIYYSQQPGMGRYHTILGKFENEQGGVRDWSFD